jgi:hypothetical protein
MGGCTACPRCHPFNCGAQGVEGGLLCIEPDLEPVERHEHEVERLGAGASVWASHSSSSSFPMLA